MTFRTPSFKPTFILILTLIVFSSCKKEEFDEPKISLASYQIEKGFELQVAVSEPFIEAPVAMEFDNQGRMWAVEMKGYMRNLQGTGEDIPNGVISILEDLDNDGVVDHSKVFLDSLVLPRAIAHVYGGLLYAEPPMLWFVDIKDDKPVNRVLVDSSYASGGNVEHQPNGLMMHIDNWIYNAKSSFRYQRKNGKWLKERTAFRGQWGITKDNFGRLYYNTNSVQLIGDYVLPNTTNKNPNFKGETLINQRITPSRRVYPWHPTSVNRGYVKGVLDKDSILINVTSACGPLIYRGDNFGKEYVENGFVCAPEANVVKRNILTFEASKVSATQAIPEKEFIRSKDEGFRPVNLNNGPYGNMYVVDMHRGILQDKVFLTSYLKNHYAEKQLDTIIGMGRILRVVKQGHKTKEIIDVDKLSIKELVTTLSHENGWLRDRAQQALVLKNDDIALPLLKKVALDSQNKIAQIHAIHTLNGINGLSFEFLQSILNSNSDSDVLSHVVVLAEGFASKQRLPAMLELIEKLIETNNEQLDLYILNSLNGWAKVSKEKMFPVLYKLSNRYTGNLKFEESAISSLRGLEEDYQLYIKQQNNEDLDSNLNTLLQTTLVNKENRGKNKNNRKNKPSRAGGYKIFRNFCATCHGFNGEGVDQLAPPLENSEYVTGSTKRLGLVLLHGLAGPVHVNGKLYELNGTMPGLANNPDFTDLDIQNIISYLHSTFSKSSESISLETIKALRDVKPKVGGVYSEKELMEYK